MLSLELVAFQTRSRFSARWPVTQFHLKEMTVFLVCFLTTRQQNAVPLNLLLSLKITFFFNALLRRHCRSTDKEMPSNIQAFVAERGDSVRVGRAKWGYRVVVSCGSREVCCVTSRVPTVGKGLKSNWHSVPVYFDSAISVWGRLPCCYKIARISVSVPYSVTDIMTLPTVLYVITSHYCRMWLLIVKSSSWRCIHLLKPSRNLTYHQV